MLNSYFPVLVLMVLAAGFLVMMLGLCIFLGPTKLSKSKDDPFECGTIGTGDPNDRMGVKFYLVAMIFILFDIEIIFMFPWAVNVLELGWFSFWAMLSFIFTLVVGLSYVWKRGVLDWT
jgi:NADH-quinone oxidoreductase subunit A